MIVLLLGAPGAGKGTHAARIADHTGLPHVSSGELLRGAVERKTELGVKAREHMAKAKGCMKALSDLAEKED